MLQQITSRIFMVRPAHFAFNEQTAESNSFQNIPKNIDDIHNKVLAEFDAAVATLRTAGVEVWVIDDTKDIIKPDAIFPNNWISTHEDGTIILYPMLTPNRRAERRMDVVNALSANFKVNRVVDLSYYEDESQFLEGTGSIVFDHEAKLAYACLSPRTHLPVLQHLCQEIGYKPVAFRSADEEGKEVYHTNVIMGVAKGFVVLCLDSVWDEAERILLQETIASTGKKLINISMEQVRAFGGNVLAVSNVEAKQMLALSSSAYPIFTQKQIETMEQYATMLPISIPTIETIGGGSVRCMMAQNFLTEINLPA